MRKAIQRWLLERRIRRTKILLVKINEGITKAGIPRWKRKQIWRDFVRSAEVRQEVFDLLKVSK